MNLIFKKSLKPIRAWVTFSGHSFLEKLILPLFVARNYMLLPSRSRAMVFFSTILYLTSVIIVYVGLVGLPEHIHIREIVDEPNMLISVIISKERTTNMRGSVGDKAGVEG